MSGVWALRGLRWAYVAFIAAASAMAVRAGMQGNGEGSHDAYVVLVLAIPELIAALAFLVGPVEVAACAVLVLVYAAATALSLASGDWLALLRFFFYGTTAIYIVLANRSILARQRIAATMPVC